MLVAAAVEWWLGVDSERKVRFEDVTIPLSSEEPTGPSHAAIADPSAVARLTGVIASRGRAAPVS